MKEFYELFIDWIIALKDALRLTFLWTWFFAIAFSIFFTILEIIKQIYEKIL